MMTSAIHWAGRAAMLACTGCLMACGPRADGPLQGYIEGEYARVVAPFAGTLQNLAVLRGSQVSAGAPLFSPCLQARVQPLTGPGRLHAGGQV